MCSSVRYEIYFYFHNHGIVEQLLKNDSDIYKKMLFVQLQTRSRAVLRKKDIDVKEREGNNVASHGRTLPVDAQDSKWLAL